MHREFSMVWQSWNTDYTPCCRTAAARASMAPLGVFVGVGVCTLFHLPQSNEKLKNGGRPLPRLFLRTHGRQ